MKRVAVILSGCGVFDGAEIHESVLTLLALDRAGATVTIAAPDVPQYQVINHQTGQPVPGETRNVRVESARIARGPVKTVAELDVKDFDAVILPGGFGAAKNLCSFAYAGKDFTVEPTTEKFLKAFHATGKPIGFACIAPAICAKLFGSESVEFTIGNDPGTAQALSTFGGKHVNARVDEIVYDARKKIVTTPAYMLAQNISEAEKSITKLVNKILEIA